uniref:Uncharacterized protein n=1 Tax=Lutzomyia longipalpis TaxID=7200 RepID=A0A1B0CWA0_LUTLO
MQRSPHEMRSQDTLWQTIGSGRDEPGGVRNRIALDLPLRTIEWASNHALTTFRSSSIPLSN